jgi:hypothetical protein
MTTTKQARCLLGATTTTWLAAAAAIVIDVPARIWAAALTAAAVASLAAAHQVTADRVERSNNAVAMAVWTRPVYDDDERTARPVAGAPAEAVRTPGDDGGRFVRSGNVVQLKRT